MFCCVFSVGGREFEKGECVFFWSSIQWLDVCFFWMTTVNVCFFQDMKLHYFYSYFCFLLYSCYFIKNHTFSVRRFLIF